MIFRDSRGGRISCQHKIDPADEIVPLTCLVLHFMVSGEIRHTIDSVGLSEGHWYFCTFSAKEAAFWHSGAGTIKCQFRCKEQLRMPAFSTLSIVS